MMGFGFFEGAFGAVLSDAPNARDARNAPNAGDAKIVKVTVYPGLCRVTREAVVPLSGGTVRVVLPLLPAHVVAGSVRVEVSGPLEKDRKAEVLRVEQTMVPASAVKLPKKETEALLDELNAVEDKLAQLSAVEQAYAAHVGQPPTLRRLRETLATIEQLTRNAAQTSGESTPSPAVNEAPGAAADVAMFGASAVTSGSGAIKSRADAYYRLAEAAEYLMRTEPHSPVPYLVKRAVQWGNMSLAQLLYEFIGNPEDLVTIQRLLGMRNRDEA